MIMNATNSISTSLIFRSATQSDAKGIAKIYLGSRKEFVPFAAIAHSEEAVHQWIRDVLIPDHHVISRWAGLIVR